MTRKPTRLPAESIGQPQRLSSIAALLLDLHQRPALRLVEPPPRDPRAKERRTEAEHVASR